MTPLARLHVIGTSLILAPAWLRRHLVRTALRAPFFNLELHGIDLADAEADEMPPALDRPPARSATPAGAQARARSTRR